MTTLKYSSVCAFAVAFLASTLVLEAQAAPFTLKHTLNNPSPAAADRFGASVAVSGNTLLTGAPFNDRSFTDDGIAYVYDVTSGARTRNIFNPRPSTGDHFGLSADLDGHIGIIGSHFDDVGGVLKAGRAYVYDTTTGARLLTINNPEASTNDFFGDSVAISGANALVGGRNLDAGPGSNIGAAYLFDSTNGSLVHTFTNPNPSAGDLFGFDLDVDGDIVAVAAEGEDTGASNSGAVYLFDAISGALTQSIFNPNPGVSDVFGQSLNVFDGRLIVGAAGDDTSGVNSGSAYLYDATTGGILHTFTNPTASAGDSFGAHVAMNDDFIVITAAGDDTAGTDAGSAYIYDALTFNLLQTITNPIPSDTGFGGGGGVSKISLGTDWLAISNANGSDSGRVFLYASASVPSGGGWLLMTLGLASVLLWRRRATNGVS